MFREVYSWMIIVLMFWWSACGFYCYDSTDKICFNGTKVAGLTCISILCLAKKPLWSFYVWRFNIEEHSRVAKRIVKSKRKEKNFPLVFWTQFKLEQVTLKANKCQNLPLRNLLRWFDDSTEVAKNKLSNCGREVWPPSWKIIGGNSWKFQLGNMFMSELRKAMIKAMLSTPMTRTYKKMNKMKIPIGLFHIKAWKSKWHKNWSL